MKIFADDIAIDVTVYKAVSDCQLLQEDLA